MTDAEEPLRTAGPAARDRTTPDDGPDRSTTGPSSRFHIPGAFPRHHAVPAAEELSAGTTGPDTHLHAPVAPPATPVRRIFFGLVVALLVAAGVLAVLGRIGGFHDLGERL